MAKRHKRGRGGKANWSPFTFKPNESITPDSLASNDPMAAAAEEVRHPTTPTAVPEEPTPQANSTPHEEEAASAAKDIDLSPRAKTIAAAYSALKLKGSWSLGLFSAPNPERLGAIDFIASIEANAPHLFHAACTHVLLTIEQPYQKAWYWKDPKASGMYTVLTEALGDNSPDRLTSLTELQNYLKEETAQSKTQFGGRSPADVLAALEQQIQQLSSETPAPLAATA